MPAGTVAESGEIDTLTGTPARTYMVPVAAVTPPRSEVTEIVPRPDPTGEKSPVESTEPVAKEVDQVRCPIDAGPPALSYAMT